MAKEMPEVPGANGPDDEGDEACPGCDGVGERYCSTCLAERRASDGTVECLLQDVAEAITDVHTARWSTHLDASDLKVRQRHLKELLHRAATEFGVRL